MTLAEIRELEERAEEYDTHGDHCRAWQEVDAAKIRAWPALVALLEEARDVLTACVGTGPIVGEARRRVLARIDGDLTK